MRYFSTTYLSQMVDESARTNPMVGAVVDILLKETLADHMPYLIKYILFNPMTAVLYIMVAYIVFCIIYTPFFCMSFLVTGFGSFLIFLWVIAILLRTFSRSMTFPGSGSTMAKTIAVDFLKRFITPLERIAIISSELMSALLLITTSYQNRTTTKKPRNVDINALEQRFRELTQVLGTCPRALGWLSRSLASISDKLSVPEQQTGQKLVDGLSLLLAAHGKMAPNTMQTVRQCHLDNYSGAQSVNAEEVASFIEYASKCLQASEMVKASAAAMRPKPPKDEEDPVLGQVLALLPKSVASFERLSFPIMREQLSSVYGAQRISVAGRNSNVFDRNTIDLMYVPAASSSGRPQTQTVSPAGAVGSVPAVSSLGTVLLCAPNAGMYELYSQQNRASSWLGIYTKLGFDVCVFNYRGYGESTGVPTPYRMKRDGAAVVEYLVEDKNVQNLIIHGESIGGMVASHIASHSRYKHLIKLLICDKSFASLDSVAARMLGEWASVGLRYIGHWYTNVVLDYLNASCPKICLQDPNDEIVSHTASLKVGLASLLVRGDRLYLPRTLPRDYIVASYLNEPVPHSDEGYVSLGDDSSSGGDVDIEHGSTNGNQSFISTHSSVGLTNTNSNSRSSGSDQAARWLRQASDLSGSLPQPFIDHFCACVLSIGKSASAHARMRNIHRQQAMKSTTSALHSRRISVSTGGGSVRSPGSHYPVTPHGSSVRMRGSGSSGANSEEDPDIATVDSESDHSRSSSPSGTWSNTTPGCPEGEDTPYDYETVTLLEKVWMILARFDGGTGQLLGPACQGGADSLTGWLSAFILFHPSVISTDIQMPPNKTSSDVVLSELAVMISTSEFRDQSRSVQHLVSFVVEGIKILVSRQVDFAHSEGNSSNSKGMYRGGVVKKYKYNLCRAENLDDTYDKMVRYISHTTASVIKSIPFGNLIVPPIQGSALADEDHEDGRLAATLASSNSSNDLSSKGGVIAHPRVGWIIPIHCGHNGWVSDDNIREVKRLIREYGCFDTGTTNC